MQFTICNLQFIVFSAGVWPITVQIIGMGVAQRHFIVSRDKKLVWNAVMELRNTKKQFIPPAYRISPVYPGQLPELLFR